MSMLIKKALVFVALCAFVGWPMAYVRHREWGPEFFGTIVGWMFMVACILIVGGTTNYYKRPKWVVIASLVIDIWTSVVGIWVVMAASFILVYEQSFSPAIRFGLEFAGFPLVVLGGAGIPSHFIWRVFRYKPGTNEDWVE